MSRAAPALSRHLLTRSDLAQLEVRASEVMRWLADGWLELVGALPSHEREGNPVFAVADRELRLDLAARLRAIGKDEVVFSILRVRSVLSRALIAIRLFDRGRPEPDAPDAAAEEPFAPGVPEQSERAPTTATPAVTNDDELAGVDDAARAAFDAASCLAMAREHALHDAIEFAPEVHEGDQGPDEGGYYDLSNHAEAFDSWQSTTTAGADAGDRRTDGSADAPEVEPDDPEIAAFAIVEDEVDPSGEPEAIIDHGSEATETHETHEKPEEPAEAEGGADAAEPEQRIGTSESAPAPEAPPPAEHTNGTEAMIEETETFEQALANLQQLDDAADDPLALAGPVDEGIIDPAIAAALVAEVAAADVEPGTEAVDEMPAAQPGPGIDEPGVPDAEEELTTASTAANEPEPATSAPAERIEPAATAALAEPLAQGPAAEPAAGAAMQRVESFLGELRGTLVEIVQRPQAPAVDLQPIVAAVGEFGLRVEHGVAVGVHAALSGHQHPQPAPVSAPMPVHYVPQRIGRTGLLLSAVALLLLCWGAVLWFKTGNAELALGTVIGANLVGCCLLAGRR